MRKGRPATDGPSTGRVPRWSAATGNLGTEMIQPRTEQVKSLSDTPASVKYIRRSNADKRRAVLDCLKDPKLCDYSASWLAETCAVSPQFVSNILREAVSNGSKLSEYVVSKDGKRRPRMMPKRRQGGCSTSNGWKLKGNGSSTDCTTGKTEQQERPHKPKEHLLVRFPRGYMQHAQNLAEMVNAGFCDDMAEAREVDSRPAVFCDPQLAEAIRGVAEQLLGRQKPMRGGRSQIVLWVTLGSAASRTDAEKLAMRFLRLGATVRLTVSNGEVLVRVQKLGR